VISEPAAGTPWKPFSCVYQEPRRLKLNRPSPIASADAVCVRPLVALNVVGGQGAATVAASALATVSALRTIL
jgi:hypothetical protein